MMDWLNRDTLSRLAKKATDILYMNSPVATSLGITGGFCVEAIVNAFRPLWENSKVVDFSNLHIYSYVFSGIFICNLVSVMYALLRRERLSKEIEDAFAFIKLTKYLDKSSLTTESTGQPEAA